MLPGTYHIYVNAFDAEPIVELREKTFVDSFSVDIYLGMQSYFCAREKIATACAHALVLPYK